MLLINETIPKSLKNLTCLVAQQTGLYRTFVVLGGLTFCAIQEDYYDSHSQTYSCDWSMEQGTAWQMAQVGMI
jgi:hypothetical protein